MLQIRTDYSTYTANIPADQSEKLFRKIVADIIANDEFGASRSVINEYLPKGDALQEDIPEAETERKTDPKQPKSPEAHPDVRNRSDASMEGSCTSSVNTAEKSRRFVRRFLQIRTGARSAERVPT